VADDGSRTARADVCEFWVFSDLDTPALVFGEVPMKIIHLVQGDEIDIAFDEVHGKEMAADVEMEAAVGETGVVGDVDGGDREGAVVRFDHRAMRRTMEGRERQ